MWDTLIQAASLVVAIVSAHYTYRQYDLARTRQRPEHTSRNPDDGANFASDKDRQKSPTQTPIREPGATFHATAYPGTGRAVGSGVAIFFGFGALCGALKTEEWGGRWFLLIYGGIILGFGFALGHGWLKAVNQVRRIVLDELELVVHLSETAEPARFKWSEIDAVDVDKQNDRRSLIVRMPEGRRKRRSPRESLWDQSVLGYVICDLGDHVKRSESGLFTAIERYYKGWHRPTEE